MTSPPLYTSFDPTRTVRRDVTAAPFFRKRTKMTFDIHSNTCWISSQWQAVSMKSADMMEPFFSRIKRTRDYFKSHLTSTSRFSNLRKSDIRCSATTLDKALRWWGSLHRPRFARLLAGWASIHGSTLAADTIREKPSFTFRSTKQRRVTEDILKLMPFIILIFQFGEKFLIVSYLLASKCRSLW